MILNVHSDTSYLSELQSRSHVSTQFFLGWIPDDMSPLESNGAILTLCTTLKFVAALAAEVELGALFLNCREPKILCLVLEELGHLQPPTPVACNNSTTTVIANNMVKKARSRSMEIRYFWVADHVKLKKINVGWQPEKEQLADYTSKHHTGPYHQEVQPTYLYMDNSPTVLKRTQ